MANPVPEAKHIQSLQRTIALIESKAAAHELLGVAPTANASTTRAAWLQLARLLHPDQAVFHRHNLSQEATRATQAINRAQQEMSSPSYAASHRAPTAPIRGQEKAQDTIQRFRMAKGLSQRGQWKQAEEKLTDDNGDPLTQNDTRCHALLGWIIYNNPAHKKKERREVAKATLERVTSLSGDRQGRAMAHHYLALLYQAEDNLPKAQEQVERCLKVDPNHQEAASLLRLLNLRAQNHKKKQDRPGNSLWRRFIGKA